MLAESIFRASVVQGCWRLRLSLGRFGGIEGNNHYPPLIFTPFLLLLGREAVCTLRRGSSSSNAPLCGGFGVETCARHGA